MTLLSATDLTVTAGGEPRLDSVSFDISPGETVLLAGPSGSGKTLLGKALGGLLGDRSSLSVDGEVTRNGEIGFLFQNPRTQLVRRGVRQDIAFGLENRGTAPSDIEAEIRAWANRFSVAHLLDRGVEDLSRGETTIVALLGTLVVQPDVIILDEPLAPLDDRNRRRVLQVLEELREGDQALLVAEHDARDLLGRVDRVAIIENGRISARGQPREVAEALSDAGIRLPFETRVALERGQTGTALPLAPDGGGSA